MTTTPSTLHHRPAVSLRPRLDAALTMVAVTLAAVAVAPQTGAAEDTIASYPVAFTGGIGAYLRDAPDNDDTSRLYAVPDGALVPDECETTGTPRTNSYGQISDVYVRAPGGVYVNSTYLDTGVEGRTAAPDCATLDAARAAELAPRTVGDRLRDGADIIYTTDGPNRIRGYYSHNKTSEAADIIDGAADRADLINNLLCTTAGVLVAVATDGTTLVASTAAGASSGFGCGAVTSNQVRPVASVATSADHTGKCLELRFHADGDHWTLDDNGWTMTDSYDYCG